MADASSPYTAPAASPLREEARSAWGFGIAAMGLAMVAPCGSYITLLAALPLGIIAMTRAKRILEGAGGELDAASQVYAETARLTGLMAAIWSGIVLAFVVLFILLYAGMFAVIFGAALTATPPPPAP
jgi:hypothetical protein